MSRLLLPGFVLLLISGCSQLGYYQQAVMGQTNLLIARQPVHRLLEQSATPPALKERLRLATEILQFAEDLGLPVGSSYQSYVALDRPFVVWNVFAASPVSVNLLTHCFPVAGCVGYRGFFDMAKATDYAKQLEKEGFEVFVGGVAAYSTLGWFNDPLLSTFIYRDDTALAALLFHELAHKLVYVEGDTAFNESFATAVERFALRHWLVQAEDQDQFEGYIASQQRTEAVIELILAARETLRIFYAANQAGSPQDIHGGREQIISELKLEYQRLRSSWTTGDEFEHWMAADINNARIGAISAYRQWVGPMEVLLAREGWRGFIRETQRLALLPKQDRERELTSLGKL